MPLKKAATVSLLLLFLGVPKICFSASSPDGDDLSSLQVIGKRNIFRPLWNISQAETVQQPSTKSPAKKNETELRLEELANRKKEIESAFIFSGIIFEHNETQAVLQSRKTGKSYIVKKGDTMEDMKVISIDPSNGEVVLDHKELSTLSFHLQ